MSAANFAPYQPPPDDRQRALLANAPASSRISNSNASSPVPPPSSIAQKSNPSSTIAQYSNGRPSFDDTEYDDPRYATESYQSSTPTSAVPQHSYASSPLAQPAWAAASSAPSQARPQPTFGAARPDHLSFATAHGWNLSNLCFAAWALPPFSSVLLLIIETENDLVRFHAYQAGLFGVAVVVSLWILRSLFGWKTLSIIAGMGALGYSWVCGSNAANAAPTLARSPYLPALGVLAEQWLGEE